MFTALNEEPTCRAILLLGSAENQHIFCSGVDISQFAKLAAELSSINDPGRRALKIGKMIHAYQQAFTSLEQVAYFTD